MSKAKHEAVSEIAAATPMGQFKLALMGDIWATDPETADIVSDLATLFYWPTERGAEYQRARSEVAGRLLCGFLAAFEKNSVAHIERVTEGIKVRIKGPVSPKYMWLQVYLSKHSPIECYKDKSKRVASVTFEQLREAYENRFDYIDDAHLRQMVRDTMKWKLAPTKSGPKPKRK